MNILKMPLKSGIQISICSPERPTFELSD